LPLVGALPSSAPHEFQNSNKEKIMLCPIFPNYPIFNAVNANQIRDQISTESAAISETLAMEQDMMSVNFSIDLFHSRRRRHREIT
jgi:hypothetical protein